MTSPLPAQSTVLLVDDDPAWLRSLSLTLRTAAGVGTVLTCEDPRQVRALLAAQPVWLVMLDLTMPHVSGEELLAQLAEENPGLPVIILSGINQLETAMRCMRNGAFDYFVKTDEEERIVAGVRRALRMVELQSANDELARRVVSRGLKSPEHFAHIVTAAPSMMAIFSYLESVSRSPQPLCISGESGTGKELLARAAHTASGCAGKLVAVNVAGLDDAMFSDTLFGHVKGAFTGADKPRRGMIEEAASGTLFLDEIGDLSLTSQVKLLRLIQEHEYFPVGSDQPKRLKARVICATHADLRALEAAGKFRKDLYYRLHTHQVQVPPLRERPADVGLLARFFVDEAAKTLGVPAPRFPRGMISLLSRYPFPGNVRELRAILHDAVSVCSTGVLSNEAVLSRLQPHQTSPGAAMPLAQNPFAAFDELPTFRQSAQLLVEEAMARAGSNQTLAARLLGISQPALNKRLRAAQRELEP